MPKCPHFDYRVVKKYYILPNGDREPYFEICQVYYNRETSWDGHIEMYGEEGHVPHGDSIEFLQGEFNLMSAAFKKPILEEVEISPYVFELKELKQL